MSEAFAPVGLVVLAWLFFAAEPVVPSFGLLTVSAIALCISATWRAFSMDTEYGWYIMCASAPGAMLSYLIGLRLLMYSPMVSNDRLPDPPPDEPIPRPERDLSPGDRGVTRSALRPLGTARFGGIDCEVTTVSGIIPAGTEIEVTDIRGGRAYVAPVSEPRTKDDVSGESNASDRTGQEG